MLRLGPSPTGHYPIIRPSRELVPLSPHLLIKGSQQDIAQQQRDNSSLRSSPWSRKFLPPFFIARLQHLLNELQHSAVSNLLSDQGQEFFVIYGSEKVFEIRIADATPYLGRIPTGWIAPACGWRTHSITSSARASSDCGTSRPSALAVFRLMRSYADAHLPIQQGTRLRL